MSPWGKFFLKRVEYNPEWWNLFSHWGMWYSGILDHMIETYCGRQYFVVERHLNLLQHELDTPSTAHRRSLGNI
jgi:hypothetical protein